MSKRGFQGYPLATVALYGPTAERASKVGVAIFLGGDQPGPLRRWTLEDGDVRFDPAIDLEMLSFVQEHNVSTVAMADEIIGCPHEEGIDYPVGAKCPQCPYWASRDRFTHERIQ